MVFRLKLGNRLLGYRRLVLLLRLLFKLYNFLHLATAVLHPNNGRVILLRAVLDIPCMGSYLFQLVCQGLDLILEFLHLTALLLFRLALVEGCYRL